MELAGQVQHWRIPVLGRWRREYWKFKVILSYLASLRLSRVIWSSVASSHTLSCSLSPNTHLFSPKLTAKKYTLHMQKKNSGVITKYSYLIFLNITLFLYIILFFWKINCVAIYLWGFNLEMSFWSVVGLFSRRCFEYTYVGGGSDTCVWKLVPGCFLGHSPPYSLRQDRSPNLELAEELD